MHIYTPPVKFLNPKLDPNPMQVLIPKIITGVRVCVVYMSCLKIHSLFLVPGQDGIMSPYWKMVTARNLKGN